MARECRELAGASTHEVIVVVLCADGVGLVEGRPKDGCKDDTAVPVADPAVYPDLGPPEALHVRDVMGSHRPCVPYSAGFLGAAGHRLSYYCVKAA